MNADEVQYYLDMYLGTQRAFGIDSDEAEQAGERYRAAVRELGDGAAA